MTDDLAQIWGHVVSELGTSPDITPRQLAFVRLARPLGLFDGTLLLFTHRDVPGLIGFIGNTFGRHNVNIANMNVGREQDQPGGEAIGVVKLDSVPPESAMDEVRAHPDVVGVSLIKLPKPGEAAPWLSF